MKIFLIFFSLSQKINLDFFSIYDFNHKDYNALLQPNLILSEKINWFRVYFNGGFYYLKGEKYEEIDWKLYQIYLKFYRERVETKIGRIVFIPGFLGIFNPFYKGLNFETISTIYEGDDGLFFRYNHFLSPIIFLYEEKSFKKINSMIQLENNFGKFTNGFYLHLKDKNGIGFFIGYFSSYTIKTSFLKERDNFKLNVLFQKRIKNLIFDLNFYHNDDGEILLFPGAYLFSKNIFSLEMKFPEKIFEVPYILIIYDFTNNLPLILFDYKYTFKNNIIFETGVLSYLKSQKLNFSIFAGIKVILAH
ncbi:MAG: hypothetical protein ABDH37_04575 [Candidatus Hydrothermales bacterium]